jgi:hypothetical protein
VHTFLGVREAPGYWLLPTCSSFIITIACLLYSAGAAGA